MNKLVCGQLLIAMPLAGVLSAAERKSCLPDPDDTIYRVERVIDGDTFVAEGIGAVDLLGSKAPAPDKCYGPEAKRELTGLLKEGQVKLALLPEVGRRDDGSTPAYVFYKPKDEWSPLAPILILSGHVVVDTSLDHPCREAWENIEKFVRPGHPLTQGKGKGLWAECGPVKATLAAGPGATKSGCEISLESFDLRTRAGEYDRKHFELELFVKNNASTRVKAWQLMVSIENVFGDPLVSTKLTDGSANIEPGQVAGSTFGGQDNPFIGDESYDKLASYAAENLKITIDDCKVSLAE